VQLIIHVQFSKIITERIQQKHWSDVNTTILWTRRINWQCYGLFLKPTRNKIF